MEKITIKDCEMIMKIGTTAKGKRFIYIPLERNILREKLIKCFIPASGEVSESLKKKLMKKYNDFVDILEIYEKVEFTVESAGFLKIYADGTIESRG